MRRIDIDDIDRAERMFTELAIPASRALPVIENWLTLAARHGADKPGLRALWSAGAKRWNIDMPTSSHMPLYMLPDGCLPTLLCWLF